MTDRKAYIIATMIVVASALILSPTLEAVFVLVMAVWLAGVTWSTAQFLQRFPALIEYLVNEIGNMKP